MEALVKALGTAVREQADDAISSPKTVPTAGTRANDTASSFSACRHFFASGIPPVVAPRPTHRALCYDAFTILHSGESKTAVFVAQKLNRASVLDADEERTDKFFADARLPSVERATLPDYIGSGLDKGHLAPAGDMPTAQSFSLAIWSRKTLAITVEHGSIRSRYQPKICRQSKRRRVFHHRPGLLAKH